MSLFKQLARVRAARQRIDEAREDVTVPAAALLARGYRYPLSSVGIAAGAGFALAKLDLHPLRVPGVQGLLNGSIAELVAQGTQLLAGLDLGTLFGGNDPQAAADAAQDASST